MKLTIFLLFIYAWTCAKGNPIATTLCHCNKTTAPAPGTKTQKILIVDAIVTDIITVVQTRSPLKTEMVDMIVTDIIKVGRTLPGPLPTVMEERVVTDIIRVPVRVTTTPTPLTTMITSIITETILVPMIVTTTRAPRTIMVRKAVVEYVTVPMILTTLAPRPTQLIPIVITDTIMIPIYVRTTKIPSQGRMSEFSQEASFDEAEMKRRKDKDRDTRLEGIQGGIESYDDSSEALIYEKMRDHKMDVKGRQSPDSNRYERDGSSFYCVNCEKKSEGSSKEMNEIPCSAYKCEDKDTNSGYHLWVRNGMVEAFDGPGIAMDLLQYTPKNGSKTCYKLIKQGGTSPFDAKTYSCQEPPSSKKKAFYSINFF